MTAGEIETIINAASEIDFTQMDWKDHLIYMAAMSEMAEKIKPLVVKYADKLPENATFLLKLGSKKFPSK